MRRKRGRPPGKTPDVAAAPHGMVCQTVCPVCGSSERAPYWSRIVVQSAGVLMDGLAYEAVVLRRTKCLKCGQHRYDREYVPHYSPGE